MATGDLGPIIDTFEFDNVDAVNPMAVHVAGTVYAVVSRYAVNEGYIRTYNVPCADPPGITLIDEWNFSSSLHAWGAPVIFHAHTTWFLIAFPYTTGTDVKSFQIADNGTITKAFSGSLTVAAQLMRYYDFVCVTGVLFVLALEYFNTEGYFYTFTCSLAGALAYLDASAVIIGAGFEWSRVLKLAPNYFAMVSKASTNALVSTANVTDLGIISAVDQQSVYGPAVGFTGKVCCSKITDTIIAVAFGGLNSDGFIQTVEINATGTIITHEVDIYEFDTSYALVMDLITFASNYVCVLYKDSGNNGVLKTFHISDTGDITEPFVSSLEIEATQLTSGRLAPFQENCLFPVYQGPDGDGFCASVELEIPLVGGPHHEMIMKIGP